jgi:flagellar biosynthetic protein FlhB
MGDEDKSFEASQQKLKKARDQGQVIKSKDLSGAIFLLVMFGLLMAMYQPIWQVLCETFILFFEQIPNRDLGELDWHLITILAVRGLVLTCTPFLVVALITAIVGELIQVGIMFTVEPLIPKPDKINPINGFKNIFSKRSIVELIKNLVKIGLLGYLAYMVFQQHLGELVSVGDSDSVLTIMIVLGKVINHFVMVAGLAFLVIAGADYLYQRNKFLGDQKMSLKEVKDEYKQTEGDPMVKHMMRQRRMQMMQQRMLEAVATADVVITNPIHVAVALKYESEKREAPHVVAKGAELFAQKIKELATKNEVPIVENPVVARSLYQAVELDQEISPDLFQAVSEILLFAWKLKGQEPPVRPSTTNPA